ncbi:glycosyl hydrolase 108 family protein [uncultured Desulfuromonas sp.]|uniref:glycoside hydrolase family 108 protein n=1 Tax=uncultured Desulfuromonas sp. TaxID=181013 RepID=UPI002AAB1FB1|nr:glycosyl hydrolase 108 family protein [uncultured Desulfuromonas sp.]
MITPVFERIAAYTLQFEGGYTFDPADPGGETKYGISKRSYPDLDIKNLTIEDAVRIYYRDYYHLPRINRIADQSSAHDLAAKTFDLAVNTGQRRAIKLLQRAINQVCGGDVKAVRRNKWRQAMARLFQRGPLAVDGIIGPITIEAINICPYKTALLMALKGEAYQHYIRQKKPLYLPGWLERLEGDA